MEGTAGQQLAPMISPGPGAPITLPPISSITSGPTIPAQNHELYAQVPLPISCARCGRTDTPLWRRDDQGRSICNACGLASKPRSLQPRPAVSSSSPSQTVNGHPAPINEAPKGSCPGDGQCNGQGGRACCQGCPAYNNRHGRNHALATTNESPAPTQQQTGQEDNKAAEEGGEPSLGGIQCENCGTRTTPLWRRDGDGRVACNACGLYWKLHGKHRPVNLNKPTIKRRKRIAPLINGPPSLRPTEGRVEVPSMPPNESQWAPMIMNGDHEQKRQRITSPHPEAYAATNHHHQQQAPPRRTSSDPMAELADVASRLEPLPSTGTPPSTGFVPLPLPQSGPSHHHASHAHPHHHHVHHHHHRPQQQQPLPRLDSIDELRGFRDALRDDVTRGRAELEHLKTSLARGEQVLEALDAKLAQKDGGHLEELIARESNNSSLSVPLKRKKEQS